jgi:hypothetical protein
MHIIIIMMENTFQNDHILSIPQVSKSGMPLFPGIARIGQTAQGPAPTITPPSTDSQLAIENPTAHDRQRKKS